MPQLVQDEAGNLFIDTGGGVYHPVTQDQAQAFQSNQGMGENALSSAAQGLENVITGAGSLLSDNPYWEQANQEGRARSEAMNLAQPVTGPASQFAPQAAIGTGVALATGGASLPVQLGASMGVEGLLGAATTPETPWQGAAFGAGGAALGVGAVPAARALMQRVPDVSVPSWFRNRSALEAAGINPGGLRPGDVDELMIPESSMLPRAASAVDDGARRAASLADDMSGPATRPGMAGAADDAVGDLPISPSANPPTPGRPTPVQEAQARTMQAAQQGDLDGVRAGLNETRAAQMADDAARATPRMADRVGRRVAAEGDDSARVMAGTMTPEELAEYGVPTSPAQQQLLRARVGGNEYETALEALRREEGRMSTPIYGENLQMTRQLQRRSATNFLATELDMPVGQNITDNALADTFQRLGKRFDDMALAMGSVEIDDGLRAQMRDVLENVTGEHASQLQRYVNEIEAKAARAGGELSGEDWGVMRSKLGKMVEAGQSQGNIEKIADARAMEAVFTQALESRLPDAERMQLARLRKQYAVAMTLTKAGARDANGVVNPGAFYRNWKKPQSKKAMARDDVGRFMNTMGSLTTNVEPNSGTAWRLGMQALQGGVRTALPAGLGGMAASVLFGG